MRGTRLRSRVLCLSTALALGSIALLRPCSSLSQQYPYSTPPDSLHPRVQYKDGSISLNDRCAVRMTRLSRSMRPVYVNGQPIGFC